MSHRFFLTIVFAALCVSWCNVSIAAADDKKPVPEQPELAPASKDAENAIGSFKKPTSWKCELFAAEPMVGNPVAFTIDNLGRVLVCESYRQNRGVTDNRGHDKIWLQADLAAQTVQDRIDYHRKLLGESIKEYEDRDDLLRLLIDSDGDHKADKSSVFASGFNGIEEGTGAGVLVHRGEVFYTNIPKLWKFLDTNNDGVADERIVMADGFGVRVAFRGHDMHGLIMGPDGRLYFSIGDRGYHVETPNGLLVDPECGAVFRCEVDGSHLEIFARGLRNPQELAFDDFGNLFTGDNNSDSGDRARWVFVVRGGDTGWRMMYQYLPDRGPFNRERIWYPFDERTPAYIVPPIANLGDGPSGLAYYPGTGLGDEYLNKFFLVDFRGQASNSGVRTLQVEPEGAFFKLASNEQTIWNVLGTDVEFGPDGAVYVSDWVNGWNGENKGRIYRFSSPEHESTKLVQSTQELLRTGMTDRGADEVASLLSHPDRRVRLESQWELARRSDTVRLLHQANSSESKVAYRLHGVWGLGQILRSNIKNDSIVQSLIQLSQNLDPLIASHALEVIADGYSRHSIQATSEVESAIQLGLKNDDARVQVAACLAVERLHLDSALPLVVRALEKNADRDPIVRHAGIMAMSGLKDVKPIASLYQHASSSVRLAAVVALRRKAAPEITQFVIDSSISVVREAVRAIHDTPALHAQLASIANLIQSDENDDAIVRRVLNANFRLGEKANAERLARFAGTSKCDSSYRIEALDMLATWDHPGTLDRVMNRYQPLADRNIGEAVDAIRSNLELLAASPDAVRDRFLVVGSKLKISEISKTIEDTYRNTKLAANRRAIALRALASLNESLSRKLLPEALLDSKPELRIAALEIQSKFDQEAARSSIERAIVSTDSNERQAAWDLISNFVPTEWKESVLSKATDDYLAGRLSNDIRLNAFEAIDASIPKKAIQAWKANLKRLDEIRSDKPVEFYVDCLEGGNVEAGRLLFFTKSSLSCVRCHRVGNTGGEVGPALSDIGSKKSNDYLLQAVVAPNETIAEGFKTIYVQTDEGSIYSGIVKKEDDKNIVLLDAQGATITVPSDEIVGRREGLSSMPSDLVKYMNRREVRDLVAYLKSLDGSPSATRGVSEATGGHAVE